MKKLNFKKKVKILKKNNINLKKIDNKSINIIDVEYYPKKAFEKISNKSNIYIKNSFEIAFKILKNGNTKILLNGPISKKHFLTNKYFGVTEYISEKFLIKKQAMLIFNKSLYA